jgi:hypothetical protein
LAAINPEKERKKVINSGTKQKKLFAKTAVLLIFLD